MLLLPLLYAGHCDPTAVPGVSQTHLEKVTSSRSQEEISEGRIIIRVNIPKLIYLILITALQGDSLSLRE